MTIKQFWTFLDTWRMASSGDIDAYFQIGSEALNQMEATEIKYFRSILGGYIYHANECVWLDMACKVMNGYVSDDTSLYFNLWVISQGREVLLNALADPDSLASLPDIPFGNAEFEMLMSLGFDLDDGSWGDSEDEDVDADFEGFHASPFIKEIALEIQYKNGERYGGFKGFYDAMKAIPEHCPKLIKRAESEGFDWKNYI
jgi:hypothetical protein